MSMAVLSVADVVIMPVVRSAGARVVAGAGGMDHPVRWVHSSELADIGPLLREGDLLLSTGIAMPEGDEGLVEMVDSLADSGAAGLVIELGRRWMELPEALIDACDTRSLPLIALAREVRFAAVAQAVGERIVDQQIAELREAQRVHETFTELSIGEAGPGDILEAVQRLAGSAVVLESEQHHVLDYRLGAEEATSVLADWSRRSTGVVLDGRTTWDAERGWLVTRVGKKERGWGRLVVHVPEQPTQRQIAMAERAAAALALHRLHDRQRDSAIRRTHHELVVGLLADPTAPGLLQRCEAAGLPTNRRQFVGIALRPIVDGSAAGGRGGRLEEVTAAVVHAAHELRVPALVCHLDGDVRAILSFTPSAHPERVVDELAERVARRQPVVVGASRPGTRPGVIDRNLREARQVVDSVRAADPHSGRVHRLDDVGLRGLLALLADDERVQLYIERQLGALREHDREWGSGLESALVALLRHPTSKTEAAAALHVSRPVFYDRIAKVERLLGVDLEDADARASLQVALIADEMARRQSS
jgi:purine catabolism regulator